VRKGFYPDAPKFPFVPGYEFAGTVEKPDNDGMFKTGDRVLGAKMFGAQAEYISAEPELLFRIPDEMTFDDASALPVNYLTAYYALYRLANVRKGEKVLIHSCAGGVGTAAVQLAKLKGAVIFGTTSRDDKVSYLDKIGVDFPINYKKHGFADMVKSKIGDSGIDIVLDPVGGDTFRESYKLLGAGGRVICYGVADLTAGSRFNFPRLIWKFLRVPSVRRLNLIQNNRGVFGLAINRLLSDADEVREVITELLQLVKGGGIKPEISKVYDFKNCAEAHRHLESGKSTGKIILNFVK
jgi:NADPH:quinone reductase-like Zn-dependent oxidoreductase